MAETRIDLRRLAAANLSRRHLLMKGGGAALAAAAAWLLPIDFRRVPTVSAAQCGNYTPPPPVVCYGCMFQDCAVDCDCCNATYRYGQVDEYNHCYQNCCDPDCNCCYPVDCGYNFVIYGCGSCSAPCPDSSYIGPC